MAKSKVVHYINQFSAGMGGEDTASVGISVRDGAVGPGLALKANLGADYEIVKTIICGDNTIAEKTAEIVPQIVELVKEAGADLFLAGPGFNAGRYGIGCGATTAAVTEQLRIPAVTALFAENPGTDIYKNRCYILQTENSAKNMRKTAAFMAAFAKRLVEGDTIKDGKEEHYHGSGPAVVIDYSIPAAKRGIDMLLAKHAGMAVFNIIAKKIKGRGIKTNCKLFLLLYKRDNSSDGGYRKNSLGRSRHKGYRGGSLLSSLSGSPNSQRMGTFIANSSQSVIYRSPVSMRDIVFREK